MKSHLIDICQKSFYEGKDFETIESEIAKLSDNYDSESINYAKLHIDEYIIQYQNAMIIKDKQNYKWLELFYLYLVLD